MAKSTLNNRRYSERVSTPQTEADWLLAFRDPNSPISKLMDNIMLEKSIRAEDRLHLLMEQVQKQTREEAKEKEMFFLNHLQSEMKKRETANEERVRYLQQAAMPPPPVSPKMDQTINDYLKYVSTLNTEIWTLNLAVNKLDEKIVTIEKKEKEITEKWIDRQEKSYDSVVKELQAKSVLGLKTGSGDVISLDDPELKKASSSSSPSEQFQKNPGLAESDVHPETIVQANNFVQEMNQKFLLRRKKLEKQGIDADSHSVTSVDVINAQKNNPEFFAAMADRANANKKQNVQDCADAKQCYRDRVQVTEEKSAITQRIKQHETSRDAALGQLSKVGVSPEEVAQRTQSPASPEQAQAARPDWPPRPTPMRK